ncbi:MAG: transglycosylase SLT domain-containing protein [Deltaproteobacteria bacterium]|nr:transglycosylase SLT domain-containing protein [Deltaproteobacteria bacterium]
MPWRIGIMAALLAWLLLASSAGAAIQRHTDSRGVIHISNGPVKAAPGHQGDLAENPGPEMAALPEPEASPARAEAQAPRPADSAKPHTLETSPPAVGEKPDNGEKLQPAQDAAEQVCQAPAAVSTNPPAPGIIGMIAAAATAAAKTAAPAAAEPAATAAAESSSQSGPDPLKKVSYEAAEAETSPGPAPQAAAPKAAEMVTAGGIQRYRDARGVWHISNVAPAEAGAGPGWLEAARTPGSERATSEKPTQVAAAGLPLQKVSWNPDDPLITLPATKTKVRTASPEAANVIRRYRDSKGVIHIDNVESAAEAPVPTLQARARPEEGDAPSARRRPPSPVEGSAPLVLKRVAWSGEEGLKLLKPTKAGSSPSAAITTEGGIKRWRDKKGVWHIETPEYPLPAGVVLPPRQGGPNLSTQTATAAAPSGSLGATAGAKPVTSLAPDAPRVPTITAFRDGRGRLKITNDAPVNLAKPPPSGAAPAPAELEPLILEAAQVHRLPATLIRAVIKTESNFCSWAVSPKGAMGLMQLMPGTAALLGVAEPFNPRENIHGGCRYLRDLINLFGGNVPLALAAYNAGYQRVINCGYQVPAIKETQDFVTQVMGRYVAEEHRAGQPWT